jgi:hypothetical protein
MVPTFDLIDIIQFPNLNYLKHGDIFRFSGKLVAPFGAPEGIDYIGLVQGLKNHRSHLT